VVTAQLHWTLGRMQERDNVVTLAHYPELLGGAGLLTGLDRYSGSRVITCKASVVFPT
jgi:hypothetical protein